MSRLKGGRTILFVMWQDVIDDRIEVKEEQRGWSRWRCDVCELPRPRDEQTSTKLDSVMSNFDHCE